MSDTHGPLPGQILVCGLIARKWYLSHGLTFDRESRGCYESLKRETNPYLEATKDFPEEVITKPNPDGWLLRDVYRVGKRGNYICKNIQLRGMVSIQEFRSCIKIHRCQGSTNRKKKGDRHRK